MISKVNPKAIGAQPAEPGRSRLMRGNPNGCRPAWKRRSCDYARPPAAGPLPRGWAGRGADHAEEETLDRLARRRLDARGTAVRLGMRLLSELRSDVASS